MADETRCPVCGADIMGFVAPGPETAQVLPCGHEIHPGHILAERSAAGGDVLTADNEQDNKSDDEPSTENGPSGPDDIETVYVVRRLTQSWTLHVERECQRLQQTTTGVTAVDPETFPEREWCSDCSPWLEPTRKADQDWSAQTTLREADSDAIDDPRDDHE